MAHLKKDKHVDGPSWHRLTDGLFYEMPLLNVNRCVRTVFMDTAKGEIDDVVEI